ncbi:MAG: hypothetical protein QOE45_1504 [Frankiaceae bacterium]|jgi:hypothetical protein|nr:hypothetical protein [Frankiaceae bacterium]
MPNMTMRTKATVAIAGATALATGAVAPAEAHSSTDTVGQHAPTLEMRGTLNPAVYHAFIDRKLDLAQAWASSLHAQVAAVPSTTVLTGASRGVAKQNLAKVLAAKRLLAKLPTTGPYAATAAERAQAAAIHASLAGTAAMLKSLLANEPVVVTPTFVKPAVRTVKVAKVFGVRDFRWFGWDGRWHDGRHDGKHRARVEGTRSDRHDCDQKHDG